MTDSGFEVVVIDGKEHVIVPPNPSGLTRGLARLPYKFEEAVSELIDNSITAGASKIEIEIDMQIGGTVYIHVLDNGTGISRENLPSAIQYGSNLRKPGPSLSVYGFGMKSASQSFTSNFALVSRVKDDQIASMITFDQELIESNNQMLHPIEAAPKKYEKLLDRISPNSSATLLVVEDANHFFPSDMNNLDENKNKKFVEKRIKSTIGHLRKTYQRFIDPNDNRAANVVISVNDEEIIPWDPFCARENLEPQKEISRVLRTVKGSTGTLTLRGFILPPKEDFSSEESYREADIGPNTHGFYVYRENRLISDAEYFELVRRDTHMSSLRIEMSYEASIDDLFKPSLNKTKAFLGDLEDDILEFLQPLLREADAQSRGRRRVVNTSGIHDPSQRKIKSIEGRIEQVQVEPIDSNNAMVSSHFGKVELPISSVQMEGEQIFVDAVEQLLDGILWDMKLINGKQAVQLNKGHEFYQRVYLSTRNSNVAAAMDMLFWALAITEAKCTIPEYRKQFRQFRYEVSKALRELAEALPEPRQNDLDE
jgi:anti-sigma regulatory factor (Ser/Thr protein kinase)